MFVWREGSFFVFSRVVVSLLWMVVFRWVCFNFVFGFGRGVFGEGVFVGCVCGL